MKRVQLTILLFLMALMAIGCGKKTEEKFVATPSDGEKVFYITPTPTPLPGTPGLVTTTLPSCKEEGLLLLVSSFYQGIQEKDLGTLSSVVSDPSLLTESVWRNYEAAKKIDVKKIYEINGEGDIYKILYVYLEVTVDGIEEKIPSLDELLISNVDGTKQVWNGALDSEFYKEIQAKAKVSGVDELVNSVNILFENAKENEDIKNFLGETE